MRFKEFYHHYLLVEAYVKIEAFGGRGIEVPTSTNPIVLVKNPIPADVEKFPSVIEKKEISLKGFVDKDDLYIMDAIHDHGEVWENDSKYENMFGIIIIISEYAVLIGPSGAYVQTTHQQQRDVENNQVLKDLFPGKQLMVRVKRDPPKMLYTRREGD